MWVIVLFFLISRVEAQLPAFAQAGDTVQTDSAILVIGDVIVGEYAYVVVTDSAGMKSKYVIFPADIAAIFERALHKADSEQPSLEMNIWERKFLNAPDTLRKKAK
jgi:hypothetical protein